MGTFSVSVRNGTEQLRAQYNTQNAYNTMFVFFLFVPSMESVTDTFLFSFILHKEITETCLRSLACRRLLFLIAREVTRRRRANATCDLRTIAHHLRVDGTRDAVMQLGVQFGQDVR